ncbi:MAG: hypothetical protein OTI36_12240 [Beijerinckiaceae bacterium]|nr:hypothetical protein [Beijerinckiaceae bacterium]
MTCLLEHRLYEIGFIANALGVLIIAVGILLTRTENLKDLFDNELGITTTSAKPDPGTRWYPMAKWLAGRPGGIASVSLILIGIALQTPETFFPAGR